MSNSLKMLPVVEMTGPAGRIIVNQSDVHLYAVQGYKTIPGTERTGPKNGDSVTIESDGEGDVDQTSEEGNATNPAWKSAGKDKLLGWAAKYGVKTKSMNEQQLIDALENAGFDGNG